MSADAVQRLSSRSNGESNLTQFDAHFGVSYCTDLLLLHVFMASPTLSLSFVDL